MIQYIDDWLFVFDTEAEAQVASACIKRTFKEWGC